MINKNSNREKICKKLNIALVATGCSSVANDLYLNDISQALRKRGHRVWLVHVNPQPSAKKKFNRYNLPVYWPGPKYKWLWFFYVLCPPLRYLSLSKAVQKKLKPLKNKLDLCDFETNTLCFGWQPATNQTTIIRGWFYPHHLLKRLFIMWLVTPLGLINKFIFILEQFWFYWTEKYSYKKADAIITLTPQLSYQLKLQGYQASWLPLAIKVPPFVKKPLPKPIIIGTTAYDLDNPRKGIDLLLQAAKLLKTTKPTVHFKIELIGNYSSNLKEKILKLGLNKDISLAGKLNHKQVIKRMNSWEIFCFPTLFEELSMVSLEAMTQGLCCVGWKIDSLLAAWSKTGILLPKKNVSLLAKTLSKLITNHKLRNKKQKQSWQRAKKYFDLNQVVTRLEKIYYQTYKQLKY